MNKRGGDVFVWEPSFGEQALLVLGLAPPRDTARQGPGVPLAIPTPKKSPPTRPTPRTESCGPVNII